MENGGSKQLDFHPWAPGPQSLGGGIYYEGYQQKVGIKLRVSFYLEFRDYLFFFWGESSKLRHSHMNGIYNIYITKYKAVFWKVFQNVRHQHVFFGISELVNSSVE